jgi:MFS family permease
MDHDGDGANPVATDGTTEGDPSVVPVAPVAASTGPAESVRASTFQSLQYPAYRTLFGAGLVVFLAIQAQQVVRGWLAAELTGSNSGLGGVFFGFAIPMLVLTPFAGVAADRFPKRTVLLASSWLLVVSAFWIGIADALDALEYWMLIGSAALQGAGFSLYGPARMSFTSELVDRKDLPNAVVLGQVSMNATRIVGPAAGGALIGVAWMGTAGTYLLTAVLMVVALVMTFPLPTSQPVHRDLRPSPYAELRAGLGYVRRNRPVLLLIVASYAVIMFTFPYVAFLPLVATEIYDVGSTGFGLMNAVSGAGAVAVSLRIASLASGARSWRIQIIAGACFGLGVIALGLSPSFPVALLALLVAGGSASAFQAMNNTLILTESDPAYHGRVQSLLMLSFSGFGLAALPLGAVADAIGLRPVLVAMGLASIVSMAGYQLLRVRLRRSEAAAAA